MPAAAELRDRGGPAAAVVAAGLTVWLAGAAAAAPPPASLLDRLEAAAREDLSGRARVMVREELPPAARDALERSGADPVTAPALFGLSHRRRTIDWTFAGPASRAMAVVEGGGALRRLTYTFDGATAVLVEGGQAEVRADRALEREVFGVHPFSYGRPFFGLDAAAAAELRAALVDEGEAVVDGRPLRVLRAPNPGQPLWRRLWVDPARGDLVVREEEHFSTGEEKISQTTVVEVTRRLADGREVATRIVEEVDFASGAGGVLWLPLTRRTTEIELLEVGAPVPPETFRQELPPGTEVDNRRLGLVHATGDAPLTAAEVFRLADLAAAPADAPRLPAARSGVRCGLYALLAASHLWGKPATLEQLEQASGFTGVGSNLADLARAAAGAGLTATGVQTDFETLVRKRLRGIAHLEGNHFVLVTEAGPEGVTVLDVPAPPRRWLREELDARWTGVLLILATAEEAPGGS